MFDFLRSIFKAAKVVHGTIRTVREDKAAEINYSALPMPEFLPIWADAMTFPAAGMRCTLRPAASMHDVSKAESRLNFSLPEELKALYLCSNGVDREIGEEPARSVLALQALAQPGTLKPLLSSQLRDEWIANGRDNGEPEGLCLYSTGLRAMLPDGYESVLAFADVDDMLQLESRGVRPMAVAVVAPHASLAVGAILQIENGTATRFDGVRQWLAAGMGMMVRHKEMFGRYAKPAG